MEENTRSRPHLILLSSPGLGHLIPVLQLCKRLVMLCNFDVTTFVVGSNSSEAETQIIQPARSSKLCRIVELPAVDISVLFDPGAAVVTRICVMMREIRPALRSAVLAFKVRPAAFIVDHFGTESFGVAEELGIPKFVYIPSNAWFLALLAYLPVLDKEVKGEYLDQKEPLQIPGCMSVRPEDVIDPMLDRTDQQYLECVRIAKEIASGDMILLNTWEDLESTALLAIREGELLGGVVKKRVFPIGPLTRPVGPSGVKIELSVWLDEQPKQSVIPTVLGFQIT
uniref:Anthocyanidin 3-O-glucosyltransferase 5 n=1 Tax=Rhizophora mucronata TaxID=61149 RepID=A0A2P2MLS7_RHIMU